MLWQHKYLHFNHGIRVNESSEGVSHCEEVTLEGRPSQPRGDNDLLCRPSLGWSVISAHHKDWGTGRLDSRWRTVLLTAHTYTVASALLCMV